MCRPALSNYSPLAVETAVEAGLILLGQPFSCLIIYDWIFCMRPAASQIHFIMVLCLTFLLKRASIGSLVFSFKISLAFKSKSHRVFSRFRPRNWGSASDRRSCSLRQPDPDYSGTPCSHLIKCWLGARQLIEHWVFVWRHIPPTSRDQVYCSVV